MVPGRRCCYQALAAGLRMSLATALRATPTAPHGLSKTSKLPSKCLPPCLNFKHT